MLRRVLAVFAAVAVEASEFDRKLQHLNLTACADCQKAVDTYQQTKTQVDEEKLALKANATAQILAAQNATLDQIAAIRGHALDAEQVLRSHQASVAAQVAALVANGTIGDDNREQMNEMLDQSAEKTHDAIKDTKKRAKDHEKLAEEALHQAKERIKDQKREAVEASKEKLRRDRENVKLVLETNGFRIDDEDEEEDDEQNDDYSRYFKQYYDFAVAHFPETAAGAALAFAAVLGLVVRRRRRSSELTEPLLTGEAQ
mmetsp:Transcript_79720/g.182624  ORF Transcript_79720/g.182624 Transcript_79720/m.182624 type:complete len:258 (-) Transcript_79720:410-1183(-)